jgi:glycerophosphoryl diester phosphodiesterase
LHKVSLVFATSEESILQQHEYFNAPRPVVLAHRGGTAHTENTLEAFADSIAAGVFSIETDVRTTKDQVAVLFHDEDLIRVAGLDQKISDITFDELSRVKLHGGGNVPSLAQALAALPLARLNLDIKDEASVKTAAEVINNARAHNRVLVSSFSERRRVDALKLMTYPVATSASSTTVLICWLIVKLRFPQFFITNILKGIGALQIPRSMYGLRFDSPRFIQKIRNSGTEVHYWTINNPQEMLELTRRGATGIVSDVSELAVQTLRKA